ncbi:probable glutathione S-transferase isoform X1 [Cucumis sativus]|uniref:glutathione transferase n=1 Tax=Cucumis sativus TaxID=3659 RepID=A0A0A0L4U8_CUCSA|nr:probable glutathione S-transferase isoform X1 [Cucumis sativus]
MDEVKLHENWLSLSACKVIWALSLKDIPYRYEEEGITNKTPFLPYSNSVSVIVDGKSISDSSVILEYIDETWPQNPLLPSDLLDKATARFWIRFIDDKGAAITRMFYPGGKEQGAKVESLEMLRILEEEVIGEEKFFGGEKIGMVDLAFGEFVEWLGVFEEVIGEKLLESGSFPRLEAWSRAFMAVPAISENRADRNGMVENIKRFRIPLPQHRSALNSSNDMKNVLGFLELFRCFCELVSIVGRFF